MEYKNKKPAVHTLLMKLRENGFLGTFCTEDEHEQKHKMLLSIIEEAIRNETHLLAFTYESGAQKRYYDFQDFYTKEFT